MPCKQPCAVGYFYVAKLNKFRNALAIDELSSGVGHLFLPFYLGSFLFLLDFLAHISGENSNKSANSVAS